MICERCGTYLREDEIICPVCGTMVHRADAAGETGVRAMRQGRRNAVPPVLPDESRDGIPTYGDYDNSPLPVEQEGGVRRKGGKSNKPVLDSFASRPNTRRGVPVHTNSRNTRQVASRHGKPKIVRQHPINWMLIGVICIGLSILAGLGYLIYLNTSDTGQQMLARKRTMSANDALLALAVNTDAIVEDEHDKALKTLEDAPAQAYWTVGQAFMNEGDMEDSIMAFRIADILDPENYDGLLLLGQAYELNNMEAEAEALYLTLLTDVSPSRSEAYTALISIYLDQDRDPEAADLMLLAYTNTDKETFRIQRNDFIPNEPEVDTDHLSGRYELEQTITVTSPQGYDIYYTLDDDAVLPEGGTLVKNNSVIIPEGTYTLRAVCVIENLVSDEMSAVYTVYYPSPSAPKCNLAPNTYSKLHTVSLRAGASTNTAEERRAKTSEQLAKEDNQTFYYTIDGSTPDPDVSPIYDGTPIQLPSGRVTLKAIAVNGYGKQSSTMEVGYKFNVKPYPLEMYNEKDTFSNFELINTSIAEFEDAFGQPKETLDTQYLTLENQAQHLVYSWGYAVFMLQGNQWQLVRIEMDSSVATAPRGVGLGSSESEITGVYKDYGMLANQDNSRNLYYTDPNAGVVLQNEDGTRTIQYTCETMDSQIWVLQYHLKNGKCVLIDNFYKP